MNYFKDQDGEVFAYDDGQISAGYPLVPMSPMTPEDVELHYNPPKSADQLRELFKAERALAVAGIVVTTASGNTFDGDEVSQGRMACAVIALQAAGPGTTVLWVLSNNAAIEATAAELTEALSLASAEQARLWLPSAE